MEVERSFFGPKLYPPLIQKNRSYWDLLPSWKCMKISAGIAGTVLGGAMLYIGADCIRVMIVTPPSDFDFAYNAVILGLDSILAGGAACVSLAACGFFRWGKKKLSEKIPHLNHYQGSVITPIRYYDRMHALQNRKICLPMIFACFDELQKRGLLDPWLRCKSLETLEEAAEYMYKRLNRGTCNGHSMALLAMMLEDYDASSAELMEKLDLQKIVYFQFMGKIIVDLMRNGGWGDFSKAFPIEKSIDMNSSCSNESLLSTTFWILALLNLDSHRILFHESAFGDIDEMKAGDLEEFFKEPFEKMEEMQNETPLEGSKGWTVAGKITLAENDKPQEKENRKKLSAHALFFQFSKAHYRFHDSGYYLEGFFEFETKEQFFESLLTHIKTWPIYKDGKLRVTVLGIPQPSPEEVYIEIKE